MNMQKKRIQFILCVSALLMLDASISSALDPNKFLSQYVHDAWLVENGLPSNTIPAIMQSKAGYLWLGTLQGLVRFDGVRFAIFDRNNAPAMRSHQILSISEDRTGAMLYGTQAGGLYAIDSNIVKNIELPGKLHGLPTIDNILYSSSGNLWLSSNIGVFLKSGKSFQTVYSKETPIGFRYSLIEDAHKTLWIGTAEGLMKFENGSLLDIGAVMPIFRTSVTALCTDADGSLWIGTNNGLIHFTDRSFSTFTTQNGLQSNAVTTLLQDKDGNIWVGTKSGLSRLYRGSIQPLSRELMPNDAILSLTEDHEGSLWIGTFANGLHRLRDGAFTTISMNEGLADDYARSIIESFDGSLLAATAKGLNRMSGINIQQIPIKDNMQINALWKSQDGAIWLGGAELLKMYNGTISTVSLSGKQPDEMIYCVISDNVGDLWIGTSKAIYRLHDGKTNRISAENGLLPGIITNILPAKNGSVYAVSFGSGLNVIQREQYAQIGEKQGLKAKQLYDLHEDSDGSLWISTAGNGLFRYKNGECKQLTWLNGLYDNTIYRILEDDRGNFWMSCPRAVFRAVKSDMAAVIDGRAKRFNSIEYGVRDGMKSGECNSGFFPAGWRSQNGLMYFPTVRGVVRVDPSKFPVNTLEPPVIIESVSLDENTIFTKNEAAAPAGIKSIAIHYAGLSLFKPENVAFRYKLEGYNDNWIENGSRREAIFTNLPPGEYNFIVTACNNDGVWNTNGASIRLVIEPYFYQTWWFRIILGLVGLLCVYGIFSLRVRQLKKREIQLQKTVDERTKDLSEANSSLHEANNALAIKIREVEELNADLVRLNKEKTTFLGIAAHDLKNPLAGIILTAQNVSAFITKLPPQKITDYMGRIEHAAQRMRDIILHLLDINAIETGKISITLENLSLAPILMLIKDEYVEKASSKQIEIEAQIPPDDLLVKADKNCMMAVLDNLTSNAIKFSPHNSKVTVNYIAKGDKIRVSVTDRGPGLNDEDKTKLFGKFAKLSAKPTGGEHSSGLGLSIVKKMAEAMNGVVGCESEFGKGATFYLEIPKAS